QGGVAGRVGRQPVAAVELVELLLIEPALLGAARGREEGDREQEGDGIPAHNRVPRRDGLPRVGAVPELPVTPHRNWSVHEKALRAHERMRWYLYRRFRSEDSGNFCGTCGSCRS